MIMLDYYITNNMLLPDADIENLDEDLLARGTRQLEHPERWAYYGEPDVFPRLAIYDDERGQVSYYEQTNAS